MADASEERRSSSARVAAYEACSHGERSDAIQQLAAGIAAMHAEMLDIVTAADRQEDWKVDGATSMAAWLVGMCGLSLSTARSCVRAGASLDDLPHLRDAYGDGRLSWEQVRPATTFVTPATDELMTEELPAWTVAQIENRAAEQRRLDRSHARERARHRRLQWRHDPEAGGCFYRGFLPDTEAELVNASLERGAEQIGPDAETGQWAPFASRCADALVELARQKLRDDPGPDPALVVIHAHSDVVDGMRDGNGMVNGVPVPRDSILRLLCDTPIEFNVEGPDGTCIGIGRTGRTIPRWLRRRIVHRDRTCRFPGCSRPIRHVHHVQYWSRGGRTDSWCLAGFCWEHHHLVHEGEWTVTGNADHELTFTSPYGRALTSRPPPLRPEVRQRLSNAIGIHLGEPSSASEAGPAP